MVSWPPPFLRENEGHWPRESDGNIAVLNDTEERKDKTASVNVCTFKIKFNEVTYLPDVSRFSSWLRLLSTTGVVLKAKEIFIKKNPKSSTLDLLKTAETSWFKHVQLTYFEKELLSLLNSSKFPKVSRIIALTPKLDNNEVIRVNGRIKESPLTKTNYEPIILHAKHPAIQLLIKYYHEKYFHRSHETVVNELRQKYWIVNLRKVLRNIINSCVTCRLQRARPPEPQMADLPPARLAYRFRPFTHCGLDYFGPISVKIGRRVEKRWGALFTCMTTRAIHIELAHSLTTDSAIMALQRFAALK